MNGWCSLGAPLSGHNPPVIQGQALHARLVYSDAEEAASRLEATLAQGGNWRIDWFAAVGLLRTIGHVLVNVDKPSGIRYPLPAHPIFSQFIKPERDVVTQLPCCPHTCGL